MSPIGSTHRQINETDKRVVIERQGLRCFIDNHPVTSEAELVFDHIQPYTDGGPTDIGNIGAVCGKHNREKGALSLSQYRDKLAMRRFFESASKRRLDNLLGERLGSGGYANKLSTDLVDGFMHLYLDSGQHAVPVYECSATGEQYFFALLPVSALQNDSELQPRPLEFDRLWNLYLHLQNHTQLAPAVCRLVDGLVLLFDGQHKAAAQVWAGRQTIDCKVYVSPDVRRLKETNLSAHDKLRQMPFYTSTLLEKYASMASEDWDAFLSFPGPKTEHAFVEFMRARASLSNPEAVKRVRSLIQRDILEHPENALREYIAEENRDRQNPLTISRLQKTFFAEFIAPPPLKDEFEGESYHRMDERNNLVHLFNLIVKHSLDKKWAPERNDAAHRKASRLFSGGAPRAWVPMFRDALAPALGLFDEEDRKRLLYRELSDHEFQIIERLLTKLFSHKVWEDPDPELADLRYDNAQRAKEILVKAGLTTNWIHGSAA